VLVSCKVDPKLQEPLPVLREIIPQGWPQPVYRFEENPISESRFELGRSLFYDGRLSKDSTISCGSCHQQNAAFANAGHRVSHGFHDLEGVRNSPGIFNLNWHHAFMLDGGVNHIELQPLAPITNPIEMNEELSLVIEKLNRDKFYPSRFKRAFGTEEITGQRVLKSLAQFMGLMYSYNSKYDKVYRGEGIAAFTEEEKKGHEIFARKCGACHHEPLFSDFGYRNNGVAASDDIGREKITNEASDRYKFKTPSLRNVALTAPYMHDGSIKTLEACLVHYNTGAKNFVNLDPLLDSEYGMQLSAEDQKNIIAFLHTLTDYEFISDQRFSDPNFNQ
jgi:cytochrome c peroxidase